MAFFQELLGGLVIYLAGVYLLVRFWRWCTDNLRRAEAAHRGCGCDNPLFVERDDHARFYRDADQAIDIVTDTEPWTALDEVWLRRWQKEHQ